jgi:hypothetical protein
MRFDRTASAHGSTNVLNRFIRRSILCDFLEFMAERHSLWLVEGRHTLDRGIEVGAAGRDVDWFT